MIRPFADFLTALTHRWPLCLLLLALVWRGLIPAGYMPQQADPLFSLTFCLPQSQASSQALEQWAFDNGLSTPSRSQEPHTDSSNCVYASLQQASLVPQTVIKPVTLYLALYRPLRQAPVQPLSLAKLILAPPVGLRGPPSFLN